MRRIKRCTSVILVTLAAVAAMTVPATADSGENDNTPQGPAMCC